MWSAGLFSLLVTGLFPYCLGLSSQYHFVSQKLSWVDAQRYCRENYHDLATIGSQEDHTRFVVHLHNLGYSDFVWVGLYNDINGWKWSLDDTDLEMTHYKNWISGEPNYAEGDVACVYLSNGPWDDAPCSDILPFLCYDAKESAPNNYVLITEQKSWSDAQRYCREKHTDLASARTKEENQQLVELAGITNVWIGLFREIWKWSDQSYYNVRLQPMNNSEEKAYCALYSQGGWYNHGCEDKIAFMCQTATQKLTTVTLKTDSFLMMEDPVVQASIAEQIKKKLQAEGQLVNVKVKSMKKCGNDKKTKIGMKTEMGT